MCGHHYKVSIEDRATAQQRAGATADLYAFAFTDGSRQEGRTGAGFWIKVGSRERTRRVSLGAWATVFQAEMLAIRGAARLLRSSNLHPSHTVHIFSDSQASLRALDGDSTKSSITWETWKELQALGRNRKLILHWVPAHVGISGNERADQLAKKASSTQPIGAEPVLGLATATLKGKVRAWCWGRFNNRWRLVEGHRETKRTVEALSTRERRENLLSLGRRDLRNILTVFTGHGNLGKHLRVMGITTYGTCTKCGLEEETADHFVGTCPARWNQRLRSLGAVSLMPQEWRSRSVFALAKYIQATGRLTEIVRVGVAG